MKYLSLILLVCLLGCVSAKAKISGTGVNVQDSMHYVDVQANSFNSEIEINATDNK